VEKTEGRKVMAFPLSLSFLAVPWEGKKTPSLPKPLNNRTGASTVAHCYNPNCYWGGTNRRIMVQGQAGRKNLRPYLKNN
jgi:hypothetical protein